MLKFLVRLKPFKGSYASQVEEAQVISHAAVMVSQLVEESITVAPADLFKHLANGLVFVVYLLQWVITGHRIHCPHG